MIFDVAEPEKIFPHTINSSTTLYIVIAVLVAISAFIAIKVINKNKKRSEK